MEAVYTTSGMQIKPFKGSKVGMIYGSRSLYMINSHTRDPVTAYLVKEKDYPSVKRLLTYPCGKTWLKNTVPEIVITTMPPNKKLEIDEPFALNPDVFPNEIQLMAMRATLENNFKTAFFNMPTGSGKTLLAVYLTSILNLKAWCMCYSVTVLKQWLATIKDKTTLDPSRVLVVNDGKMLQKMADGDWDPNKYDVYLSTPRILTLFAEKKGMDLLNDAFDTCGIGVKFFDEAHKNVGNIVKINALTNVERTYYLSGDFGQADPQRAQLYYKMFQMTPIVKPDKSTIEDMRYTVGVLVRYNTHPTFNETESCFGRYGFSRHLFMQYQLTKDNFFGALWQIYNSIDNANGDDPHKYKTLVLCTMIEHVDVLWQDAIGWYREKYPENMPRVVRFHSELPESERNAALASGEVIISTYQSMGVGVDIKNIRYVISLCPVSTIELNQAAGRARQLADGNDVFLFMFVDDGFAYVRSHLQEKLSYLEEQKIKGFHSIKFS